MRTVETIKAKALILRTCSAQMTSHGGFTWPESGPVAAPDWKPTEECGNGLHGFLWGAGQGNLASWEPHAKWLVAEIEEYIDLEGKVKFPSANVIFCGDRKDATEFLMQGRSLAGVVGAFVTAGYNGTATAGDNGTATAGYNGTATAGSYGTATAGSYGTATAGSNGTATAGYNGTATAGSYGTATAGSYGTATAGSYGTLILTWWDGKRFRRVVGYVGEDGIEPNVTYRLNSKHEIERAQSPS